THDGQPATPEGISHVNAIASLSLVLLIMCSSREASSPRCRLGASFGTSVLFWQHSWASSCIGSKQRRPEQSLGRRPAVGGIILRRGRGHDGRADRHGIPGGQSPWHSHRSPLIVRTLWITRQRGLSTVNPCMVSTASIAS